MRESFEYLISLSNKELRKEIENSNWSYILQELRYAGEEIERLNNIIDKAIEYIENHSLYHEEYSDDWDEENYLVGVTDEKESKELLDILKGSDKE